MTAYSVSPVNGDIDYTRVDTAKRFPLGMESQGSDGAVYQYIKSGGTAVQYEMGLVDNAFTFTPGLTTTNAGVAVVSALGVPQSSTVPTVNQFGWVAVKGPLTTKCAVSCAQDVKLYTTATGGVIDDSSTTLVTGIKLITTITTAAASPCIAVTKLALLG